ncbi:hypothetical protein QYE76_051256 [Lolium multiflorum]|uniref:Uncharacterized protein n=1 Tax=Lolium multiflorum TaxID=4521 RepID=A0AAD8WHR0_LOLMU|nr:hypothetical protein QYE76_051256 [Lolium multiflorum]
MINHENNSLKLEMSRGKGEDGRRGKKSHISSTAGRRSRAMATSRIQTRSLSVPRSSRPLHALSHHCLGWVIQRMCDRDKQPDNRTYDTHGYGFPMDRLVLPRCEAFFSQLNREAHLSFGRGRKNMIR